MKKETKTDDRHLEREIAGLLDDPQYEGHPLQEALAALFGRYQDQLGLLERLTSISDGYQSALRERNETLADRYRKQIRQLQKIVRISDHYQGMLQELNEELKVASTQDPLTGLPNRRLMLDRLKAEAAVAHRREAPFSLLVIDIDHFKRVNDEYGHDTGDNVLIAISRAMTESLRAYDVCARWGGEEFMALLPQTTGPEALEISHRLRSKVEELAYPELPPSVRCSVSIGIAEHGAGEDVTETVKRADMALYAAKRGGRNCIELAEGRLTPGD